VAKYLDDGTKLTSPSYGQVTLMNRRTATGRRTGVVDLIRDGQVVAAFDLYRVASPLAYMDVTRAV